MKPNAWELDTIRHTKGGTNLMQSHTWSNVGKQKPGPRSAGTSSFRFATTTKHEARSRGAKWDREARQWYDPTPDGRLSRIWAPLRTEQATQDENPDGRTRDPKVARSRSHTWSGTTSRGLAHSLTPPRNSTPKVDVFFIPPCLLLCLLTYKQSTQK